MTLPARGASPPRNFLDASQHFARKVGHYALQGVNTQHPHLHEYVFMQSIICYQLNFPTELTAALNSLGPLAWVKLSEEQVCFTIIPEQGTQVWA